MNEHLVVAEGITKNYTSGTETLRILRGINISIPRGVSVAIRGDSGSGKSTLLHILGGLDRLDSGSIVVGNHRITELSEKALSTYRSQTVGFIFQFHYLLKDFTALENVMLPAYMTGLPKKEALQRAQTLLADVHLENRSHHFPSQLSGGERQRVAVARSLVNDPDLVLADEPTGNLDPGNSAVVAELLYLCAEKRGKTLIVVTHDEGVAVRANYQYLLVQGVLRGSEEGETPEEGL
jgi:lipoprotein-releasing system ATP-binding protein